MTESWNVRVAHLIRTVHRFQADRVDQAFTVGISTLVMWGGRVV